MNSALEVLFLRRPRIDYISPPVCEALFSSSGGPIIILNPFAPQAFPTGLVLGGEGSFFLSWDTYPGALCYSVYRSDDPNNPFGTYTIVAECIPNPPVNLNDFGPGYYRITAITRDGETPPSLPVQFNPVSPCVQFVDLLDGNYQGSTFPGAAGGNVCGNDNIGPNPTLYHNREEKSLFAWGGASIDGLGTTCNIQGRFAGIGDSTSKTWWIDLSNPSLPDYRVIGTDLGPGTPVPISMNATGDLLLDFDPASGGHKSKVYHPGDQTFTDFGLHAGSTQTSPVKLADSGRAAVSMDFSGQTRAGLWNGLTLVDISPGAAGSNDSIPKDVNDSGHVVGIFLESVTFNSKSFFYNGITTVTMDGFSALLEFDVNAINNLDVSVGTADDGAGHFLAAKWDAINGAAPLTPLPGTTDGYATDINDAGIIVGAMSGGTDYFGFIVINGVTRDIMSVLNFPPEVDAVFEVSEITNDNYVRGICIVDFVSITFIAKLCL